MNGKVYVLEDDPSICELVRVALSLNEIETETFASVGEFRQAFLKGIPDVALIDVMLPDGNGFDVLTWVKSGFPDVSCLIVSALAREAEKVRGLDLGADDYIVKPFGVMELVARVKAALRRKNGSPVLRVGDAVMDVNRMVVTLNGKATDLNRKEFELLKYFMKNPDRVLSRETVLNEVWGYGYSETRTLDNHIARLRKLGFNNIETVFGVGYKFAVGEKRI